MIVRYFKLDIKWKLLRFKNQWYYVFSGEINSFKKFKGNSNSIDLIGSISGAENQYKYYPPHVDILVDECGTNANLYSGYLVDYDLNHDNLNELDKIYLLRAHRYKKKKEGIDYGNLEVRGSRVKTPIEGDIFILKATNILNLNIDFIKANLKSEEKKISENRKANKYVYRIGSGLNFVIIILVCFLDVSVLEKLIPVFSDYLEQLNFLSRFFLALLFTQFIALFMPYKEMSGKAGNDNESKENLVQYQYSWINFKSKLKWLLIFGGAYYLFYYWISPIKF